MKMGKKLGIVAMIISILVVIFGIIEITQTPELPDEFYEVFVKDQEAAYELLENAFENTSLLYNVAEKVTTILSFGGIVLSIISLVKMIKDKEKGKIIPVLSLIVIIVCWFVISFSSMDMGKLFDAGLDSSANYSEEQ